ncbi:MAG: AbrB family transcriptional regulator [Deltaproteobacteria bacterium]|jgi:membrane AbrB-like protein|nr:AbrB family transcriptional regulator [Deltaproteobacteria bacterium]
MAAGVIMATFGAELRLPEAAFALSKGFLGLRAAAAVGGDFPGILLASWPFLVGGALWAMLGAAALGIFLARRRLLPGAEAVWGLSPGGAGVMTALSSDYGADPRTVAYMQYSRVVLVSLLAVLVGKLAGAGPPDPAAAEPFFPALDPPGLGWSLAVCLAGAGLSRLARFPGGAMLFPLILGVLLRNLSPWDYSLPPWLVQLVCAVIGWRIGLGFSRGELVRLLARTPVIVAAILAMVANSGAFAVVMTLSGRFDPLTSYLATSPGGLDAVTAIAAGTGAWLPFITAMQTLRLLMVMVWGPHLARAASRLSGTTRGGRGA